MVRLGVFGGTFDPPHLGHRALACEAAIQLKLDTILWVLTPEPPHKKELVITPWQIRLEMVKAAIEGYPNFELSRVDIDRPPPYYAVDTVKIIRISHPNAQIIYLVGSDSLKDMPSWHSPGDFINSLDYLGVLKRPDYAFDIESIEKSIPGITSKISWINIPQVDISSSIIRTMVGHSLAIENVVPGRVKDIIDSYGLYKH